MIGNYHQECRFSLIIVVCTVLVGCTFQPDLKGEWGWSNSGGCEQGAPRLVITEKDVTWTTSEGKKGKGSNVVTNYTMENSGLGKYQSASLEYDAGKYRVVDYFSIKWHMGDPTYSLVSRYANKRKVRDTSIPHLNESLVACN